MAIDLGKWKFVSDDMNSEALTDSSIYEITMYNKRIGSPYKTYLDDVLFETFDGSKSVWHCPEELARN